MKSFCWNGQYVTEIEEVDQEHQQLVELINQLGEQVAEASTDQQRVASTLTQLVDYTHYHLNNEEFLMREREIDDRHFNAHYLEHQEFVRDVQRLQTQLNQGQIQDPQLLLDFLIHWLAYHILGSDQQMARQLKAIGAGQSAENAYQSEQSNLNHASDPTGPLLDALHGLFEQVRRHNQQLQELNQNLEFKVAERTRELQLANQQLQILALTDPLTLLPNRRHGMQVLTDLWTSSLAKDQPLSCMMIDADHFKQINDQYGHDAGDQVLRTLAHCLKDSLRNDDFLCRLGGDEFLVLCPDTPLEGALQLGQHLQQIVNSLQVRAGEGVWQGSVSIGVASRLAQITDFEMLLKSADEAVYTAKADGKNCVRRL